MPSKIFSSQFWWCVEADIIPLISESQIIRSASETLAIVPFFRNNPKTLAGMVEVRFTNCCRVIMERIASSTPQMHMNMRINATRKNIETTCVYSLWSYNIIRKNFCNLLYNTILNQHFTIGGSIFTYNNSILYVQIYGSSFNFRQAVCNTNHPFPQQNQAF